MRSTIVKTLFYFYGVGTGCCVRFNSVLISLRNLYPVTDRPTVFSSINVVLLLDISVICPSFVLLIVEEEEEIYLPRTITI